MTRAICSALLLLAAATAQGQETAARDSSLRLQGEPLAVVAPGKSPALAMTLSAILPGLGQLYNRSYWKVPVVAGLGGYFVYTFFQNHNDYKEYQALYQQALGPPAIENQNLLALYKARRDFYRAQRDSFGWYFFLLYFINIADAYVDASLFSFDVGDNLAFRGVPEAAADPSAAPRVQLRIYF